MKFSKGSREGKAGVIITRRTDIGRHDGDFKGMRTCIGSYYSRHFNGVKEWF
jgi:hypothetical protein